MSDLEHDDAWVFDFTDSVANHLNMRRNFPNAKTGLSGLKEEAIVCFLAFGFGTQENLPLIEDGRITRLDTVFRSILCEDFLRTNDPNLLKIIPTTPLAFEPNGLSGGPVYAIVREGMGHTARLAGVITRAGKSSIHFLKFEAYLPLLKLMRNK